MGSIETLFPAAARARSSAFAAYSGFAAGAVLRTISGAIFSGANVENTAYATGTCAEAGAIAAMVAAGQRRISEIFVIGDGEALVTRCGACRPRIRKFAGEDTRVRAAGITGVRAAFSVGALLPEAFGPGMAKAVGS